jgi:hypothetical protein
VTSTATGGPTEAPENGSAQAPLPGSTAEREVIDRFTDAFERGDVTTLVSMLTDDAWLTMPPWPLAFRGQAAAAALLTALVFRNGAAVRQEPRGRSG